MIDFERATLLMNTIVAAGQHGQAYQKISVAAEKELKAMIEKETPRVVEAIEVSKPPSEPPVRLNPHNPPTEGRTR